MKQVNCKAYPCTPPGRCGNTLHRQPLSHTAGRQQVHHDQKAQPPIQPEYSGLGELLENPWVNSGVHCVNGRVIYAPDCNPPYEQEADRPKRPVNPSGMPAQTWDALQRNTHQPDRG